MFAPKIDIAGTAKEYLVSVKLPGVEEKDIELEVHEDVLSVKAQKEHESKSESAGRGGKAENHHLVTTTRQAEQASAFGWRTFPFLTDDETPPIAQRLPYSPQASALRRAPSGFPPRQNRR
ncbi:MAG: Hsp20/alpha crystallin family protein [Deltaproteobacteria bacterium]|nr:Hsp20/alpha crystallin family protein [Deltaproteobacteria bacterium]